MEIRGRAIFSNIDDFKPRAVASTGSSPLAHPPEGVMGLGPPRHARGLECPWGGHAPCVPALRGGHPSWGSEGPSPSPHCSPGPQLPPPTAVEGDTAHAWEPTAGPRPQRGQAAEGTSGPAVAGAGSGCPGGRGGRGHPHPAPPGTSSRHSTSPARADYPQSTSQPAGKQSASGSPPAQTLLYIFRQRFTLGPSRH